MKKTINYLKNMDYKFIIINLIIIISYILILSSVGLHGYDDEFAFTYYFAPSMTFFEKITQIFSRAVWWNFRIGEILYFIFGSFPLWITYIFSSILVVIFLNLIVFYALGSEKYKDKKKVYIQLVIVYLFFMVINPIVSEVFFWIGGIYNHLFSAVIILLVGIPFRNIVDGKDNLYKFDKKYVLYLIFCFIAGFQVESTVLTLIIGIFVVNLYMLIKNRKIQVLKLLPLISLTVSFIIFMILSKNRIQYQTDYNIYTKNNMLSLFICNRELQFFTLFIITVIYLIIFKLKHLGKLKIRFTILIISFTSFIAMIAAPYYVDRGVFMLDIGICIWIVYILYEIINKIKKIYIIKLFLIIMFIIMLNITFIYRNLYIDYNEFCKIRNEYILQRINSGESFTFYIYDKRYPNKYIYKFYERLIYVMEGNSSTSETINFKYNYSSEFKIDWENKKLR